VKEDFLSAIYSPVDEGGVDVPNDPRILSL
jgi:hypothetical protein